MWCQNTYFKRETIKYVCSTWNWRKTCMFYFMVTQKSQNCHSVPIINVHKRHEYYYQLFLWITIISYIRGSIDLNSTANKVLSSWISYQIYSVKSDEVSMHACVIQPMLLENEYLLPISQFCAIFGKWFHTILYEANRLV